MAGVETIPGNVTNHTLYKRSHWGAKFEKSNVIMKLPVRYVVVSTSAGSACSELRDCRGILRKMQKRQRKNSRADIYANFFATSDGSLYEGRGWEKRNEFLGFANSRSIEISCLGDFNVYEYPTEQQVDAVASLIAYGVRHGKIHPNYYLVPSNATGIFRQTEKAQMGRNLYQRIKFLPHFVADPRARMLPGELNRR